MTFPGRFSWMAGLFWVLALTSSANGQTALTAIPKPAAGDLCPVCGMIISKYPNWTATVLYKDGHAHHFDGAKDMFKYLRDLPKYAPGHREEDIKAIAVTDFYNLGKVDARQAWFVIGSDVLGPMGHELVPLANRMDAEEFLKDHKGKRALAFGQITAQLVDQVDNGRF
jgi:nitrous oxide reductase accessory protein NosL